MNKEKIVEALRRLAKEERTFSSEEAYLDYYDVAPDELSPLSVRADVFLIAAINWDGECRKLIRKLILQGENAS